MPCFQFLLISKFKIGESFLFEFKKLLENPTNDRTGLFYFGEIEYQG